MSRGPWPAPVTADDVSVVICTFSERRWPQLQRAAASIQVQRQRPLELIVVVDSNPGLERLARERTAAEVIRSHGPPGLSGARNTALARARGEVVAFLDDDAWAEPDWVGRLAAAYTEDTIGVGGPVEPEWQGEPPRWLPPEFYWTVGCTYRGYATLPGPVRNPLGCNMSLRRSLLEVAGGFRPGLGREASGQAGCEETELCLRWASVVPSGRFLYEPRAVVHHEVGGERTRWSYFVRRCFAEGRSKAQVAQLCGRAALRLERAHAGRALPAAFCRELGLTVRHLEAGRATRAAAIVTGLGAVAAGYAQARLERAA